MAKIDEHEIRHKFEALFGQPLPVLSLLDVNRNRKALTDNSSSFSRTMISPLLIACLTAVIVYFTLPYSLIVLAVIAAFFIMFAASEEGALSGLLMLLLMINGSDSF